MSGKGIIQYQYNTEKTVRMSIQTALRKGKILILYKPFVLSR